jgi:RimJ/RimL family protein N-acetyltransferase
MTRLGVAARVARVPAVAPLDVRTSIELRTARLTLRPLLPTDRDEFLRVLRISRTSLDAMCPLGTGEETSDLEIFARQLALSEGAVRTSKACRLIAIDNHARIIGGFNINDISRGLEHSGELVFWLSADSRKIGYGQEGVRALLDYALADMPRGLGLHRVHALVSPDNNPCRVLMRRAGLRLCTSQSPTELLIGTRLVRHDSYEIFASVAPAPERSAMRYTVEGKPSIAEDLFGRGLLSILRTEHVVPETDSRPPSGGV